MNLSTSMKLMVLIAAMVLLSLPCFAKPAIVETVITNTGLFITYPPYNAYAPNQSYTFDFHVYNQSDGTPVISSITCYFHLYGINHTHLAFMSDNIVSDEYDYEFTVPAGNFSKIGDYSYLAHCNNSQVGGAIYISFQVTPNGEEPTEAKGWIMFTIMLGTTLALLFAAFLMAYLYAHTDPVNKFLKILFLGAGLMFSISSLAVQQVISESKSNIVGLGLDSTIISSYSLSIWVFRIVMIAIVLYLIYSAGMNAAGKKVGGPEQNA